MFFNFCWTPVLLIDHNLWQLDLPSGSLRSRQFSATVSSALNPIIYGVLDNNFQDEYLKVLRCNHYRAQTVVEPFFVERRSEYNGLTKKNRDYRIKNLNTRSLKWTQAGNVRSTCYSI